MNNDKTVIIADDHETLVMYLSILMRRMGFTVIPARNGEEVLQLLETILPDLIITDRKMPVVDGLTTLKTIKSNPRLADIPVIMVSAYFEQEAFDQCMELGGAGFLTKPINIHELHLLLQKDLSYPNNRQRKSLRVSYGRKVMVEHEGQQKKYYAVTLSEQGIYFRTQNPLPIGAKMQIHLEINSGEFLTTQGAVIYHKSLSNDINKLDPGMAIKFNAFSTPHADALKAHIVELLAGDLMDEQPEPVIVTQSAPAQPLQKTLAEVKQQWNLV